MGSVGNAITFGSPGKYNVYRAGGVFESPLGFLTFGLERSQSYAYEEARNSKIEEYTLNIKNPYVIQGTDFDDMQEQISIEFAKRSYAEGNTLEDMRSIMSEAAKNMEKQGYDSILMDKVNRVTGAHTYEIGVLNGKRSTVIKRRK